MKNKTIKTYQEITVEEAAQLQREGWQHFRLGDTEWEIYNLDAISHCGCKNPFYSGSSNSWHPKCAKFTEIDPCKAPVICPELEPWMAYVGMGSEELRNKFYKVKSRSCAFYLFDGEWRASADGGYKDTPYAIDVRTEWAQEHFPDHCRIRNYQEYDPRMDLILPSIRTSGMPFFNSKDLFKAYEIGRENPKKAK